MAFAHRARQAARTGRLSRGANEARGLRARETAIRALEAVCAYFPEAGELCAEASFRVGEMLRADGEAERALEAFGVARERSPADSFGARAGIEIGHIHRRAERWDDALDAYFAVLVDFRARAEDRDTALLWAGDAWLEQGAADQARRAWRHVAEDGRRALDRVRAYDRIALSRLEEGDLERARATLRACEAGLAASASEVTELGRSVRGAVLRMRARVRCEALERAPLDGDRDAGSSLSGSAGRGAN
jgi:tetratricopeptide (TPR) repeat protein